MSLDEAIEKSRSRGKHSTPLYNKLKGVVGKLFGRNKGKGKTNKKGLELPSEADYSDTPKGKTNKKGLELPSEADYSDTPSKSPAAPAAPVAPTAPVAEAKGMTFKQKFAAERKAQGAGGKFDWNGKSFTTDRADDKKKDMTFPELKDPPQSVNGGGGIDTSTGGKPGIKKIKFKSGLPR
jgi:hypothetical protein